MSIAFCVMFRRFAYLIIFVTVCLGGCKEYSSLEEYVTNRTEEFDIEISSDHFLDVMPMLNEYKLTALETTRDCVIGEVNKILYANGCYCILDRRQQKQIFVFDESGKFLRTIGRQGRGPGEYSEPSDFFVSDSMVVVYDMFMHKLNYYSLAGEFLRDQELSYKVYEVEKSPSDDGLYVVAGDNRNIEDVKGFEILKLSDNNIAEDAFLRNDYTMNFSNGYDLHIFNGDIIYAKALRSGVFAFDNSVPYLRYKFNIKPAPLPDDFEKECNGDFAKFRRKYANSYAYFNGQYWETNNYVGVGVNFQNVPYLAIYNKHSKRLDVGMVGIRYGLTDEDINGVLTSVLSGSSLSIQGDTIVGVISPIKIPQNMRAEIFSTEDDFEFANPVIVRLKLGK